METIFGEYTYSDDKALLNIDKTCELLATTYWANSRSREKTIKAIENSLCIGIYKNKEQVGFARIVTDHATIYWLCDVIVDEKHRKQGLGKKLIEVITTMEELQGISGLLATRDAHGLYEKYGFAKVDNYMRKPVTV